MSFCKDKHYLGPNTVYLVQGTTDLVADHFFRELAYANCITGNA